MGHLDDNDRAKAGMLPADPAADCDPFDPVSPAEQGDPEWRSRLLLNAEKRPRKALANVITMLTGDPSWAGVFRWNDFAQRIETQKRAPWWDEKRDCGPWTEQDDVRLVAHVERTIGPSFRPAEVRAAVDNVARRRTVNPLTKWLGALRWDGVPRVDAWCSRYLGATSATEYGARAGRWFLISAVARAYKPGCKADMMLVLEGPQGGQKSTALRTLAGEAYFSDTPLELGAKDRFISLAAVWIYELAELDGMDRADINRVKSFLSSATDHFRAPYAKEAIKVPRRIVFAGSVNADAYLRDETGNRRMLPIRCGRIDVDALARDREQLWAEAVHLFREGAAWWAETATAAAECAAEQLARVQRDAWQDIIESKLEQVSEIPLTDVLQFWIGIEPGKWSPADQNRAVRCLKLAGCERFQKRLHGGRRTWAYRRPQPEADRQPVIGGGDGG